MSEEQLTVEKVTKYLEYVKSITAKDYLFQDIPKVYNDVVVHSPVEIYEFLLSQLTTIERDTAEKCKQIAADREDEMSADYPSPGIDNRISRHFNLGEKP